MERREGRRKCLAESGDKLGVRMMTRYLERQGSITSCESLGKSLNLSVPQCPSFSAKGR